MSKSTISIRFGCPDDAALIAQFLCDLAAHDGEAETCKMTASGVLKWGFGADRRFEVLIASDVGQPVGMALIFPIFSTWDAKPGLFVNDLYVADSGRGKGIGRRLLAEVAALALRRGCGRVEWHVLHHADAVTFYEAMGGKKVEEFLSYRLADDRLTQLAQWAGPAPTED